MVSHAEGFGGMTQRFPMIRHSGSWVAFLGCVLWTAALSQEPTDRFAIKNVRVFDGIEVQDHLTVVVADGSSSRSETILSLKGSRSSTGQARRSSLG